VSWSERTISRALCNQFFNRKCILLVPNTTWPGNECDVLGVTMDLRVIDVEIKISRSDLKADAEKTKWWRSQEWWHTHRESFIGAPRPRLPREWPRKVWKHYYALPAEIWRPELLASLPSTRSGVLLLRWQRNGVLGVHCERRSTPNKDSDRLTPEQALDVARLANLRMWEAYNAQEPKHVEPEEIG